MQNARLSDAGPMSAAEVARIVLLVAREVAELHRNGVVHGYIRPSRISIAGDRVDLDPPDGAGFSKPHDVRSIGELALYLSSRAGLPGHGLLAEVARGAAALDPAARPTADELVVQLEQAAALPDALTETAPRRTRLGLGSRIGLGTAALVACGAVLAWNHLSTAEAPERSSSRIAVAPGRPATTSPAPLPEQVWPEEMRACPDAGGELTADLNGDGCEETLELRDGLLVGAGGAGGDGGGVAIHGVEVERHVTGDWHCTRHSTLAVLDTDTGAVFVFPRWSKPGEKVPAVAVGHVRGATALLAGDVDGDGCDDLRAVDVDGTQVRIAVPVQTRP